MLKSRIISHEILSCVWRSTTKYLHTSKVLITTKYLSRSDYFFKSSLIPVVLDHMVSSNYKQSNTKNNKTHWLSRDLLLHCKKYCTIFDKIKVFNTPLSPFSILSPFYSYENWVSRSNDKRGRIWVFQHFPSSSPHEHEMYNIWRLSLLQRLCWDIKTVKNQKFQNFHKKHSHSTPFC